MRRELIYVSRPAPAFERRYLAAREKEGWVYDDAALARLPHASRDDPHRQLWQIRARTATRFADYVAGSGARSVLELGCGNGWFSHLIAARGSAEVVGVDINETELCQAARVFDAPNLQFAYADIFTARLDRTFDCIVLNGVVQYFADPAALWRQLDGLLAPGGEIHVLDSPVYASAEEASAARQRSERYFANLGEPEMAVSYHHHDWTDFPGFQRQRGGVRRLARRLLRRPTSPFPWLVRVRAD